jgi:hypothetical protein
MIKDEGRLRKIENKAYMHVSWWLIDWCLMPTLAIFQLYRDVNLDEGGWKF